MKRAIGAFAAILGLLLAGERGDGQATVVNLVAHWPMDTVGATSPDAAGPHTLTNVVTGGNSATATAGFVAGAAATDAADYFTAADAAALNFGVGDFTVAAWIRPTSTASVRLINKWDNSSNQQGWLLDIHSTGGGTLQVGSIRFRIDTNVANTTESFDHVVAAGLGSGTWTHVAVTVDRTNREIRAYMNGIQAGGVGAIPAAIPLAGSVSNTLALGIGTIPTALGKHFVGAIDDVRLYNRELTAADVLTLVAPLPPVVVSPPTAGYGTVTLNWAAVPGATSYQVYYSTVSGSGYIAFGGPITGTTLTVTGLTNGTPYYFVVTADNGYADSAYSNQVTGTPVVPPPRTNSHAEGLLDDKCACGSSVGSALPALPALLAGLVLLWFRRRR